MQNTKPFCVNGRPCKLVCCSRNCSISPFVCRIDQCPCDQPHRNCKYVRWDTLLSDLQSKMPNKSQPLFLVIREFYNQAMSDIKRQYEAFEAHLRILGLSSIEQDFLRILETNQHRNLTGHFIESLEKDLSQHNMQFPFRTKEQIQLEAIVWRKQISSVLASVRNIYSPTQSTITQNIMDMSRDHSSGPKTTQLDNFTLKNISNDPTFGGETSSSHSKQKSSFYSPQFTKDSRIQKQSRVLNFESSITNDLKSILEMLKPKNVRAINLLYRASTHRFSTRQFHQRCDIVPNTLTLAKTEFGNVIGGFTPLIWNRARDGNYEPDSLGDTFLFSLTRKQKYPLEQLSKAIANDMNYGPVFGSGHDLAICDEAHVQANSFCDFPTSFMAGYNKGQESIRAFSGQSRGSSFRLLEWEVFEILFDEH